MKQLDNNYAFIDGQNLYLGVQELGWKLDYKLKFKNFKPYLRYANDLRNKLEYKKKSPHKDGTL